MNGDVPSTAIDYAAVLADLEARRSQIDAAIAVIRPLVGSASIASSSAQATVGPPAPAASNGGTLADLREDSFFGLSIPDAAKKYLGMRKSPASTPDIISALRKGGQINAASSDTYEKTVGSVLSRAGASSTSGIVRVRRGTWGLAEWYRNKPKANQDEA